MKYSVSSLRRYGEAIAEKAGMSRKDAKNMMENLLEADLRGIRSHGFTKLLGYMMRIERGITSPTAQPVITSDGGTTFSIDGNNGMGSTIGCFTMDECIRRAGEYGVSFGAVRNASHYGFGGFYAMRAAKAGMIGFSICDAPALQAAYGGMSAVLGTNPLSVAVPSGKYPDFVLDMATSTVAKGKIALALKEGRTIPDTWALDTGGNPTTDPEAANRGVLTPLGGAKGYALALLIDVICSCLAGGNNSRRIERMFEDPTKPSGVGYFMGAIDISRFVPLEVFKTRADEMYEEIKSSPAAPGFSEIMIPGEIEYRMEQKNMLEGIDISEAILKELAELSEKYEVPFGLLEKAEAS